MTRCLWMSTLLALLAGCDEKPSANPSPLMPLAGKPSATVSPPAVDKPARPAAVPDGPPDAAAPTPPAAAATEDVQPTPPAAAATEIVRPRVAAKPELGDFWEFTVGSRHLVRERQKLGVRDSRTWVRFHAVAVNARSASLLVSSRGSESADWMRLGIVAMDVTAPPDQFPSDEATWPPVSAPEEECGAAGRCRCQGFDHRAGDGPRGRACVAAAPGTVPVSGGLVLLEMSGRGAAAATFRSSALGASRPGPTWRLGRCSSPSAPGTDGGKSRERALSFRRTRSPSAAAAFKKRPATTTQPCGASGVCWA